MSADNVIVERETFDGAYGFLRDMLIVDTAKHGRLLLAQMWGGGDLEGMAYRWKQGVAAKLKPDDTFAALALDWNDASSVLEAVINGYDNTRPVLEWSGSAIERMVDALPA